MMRVVAKKYIFFLFISALVLGFYQNTYADKISELKEKQKVLREKEKVAKERLDELKSKQRGVLGEIDALDIEIDLSEEQLSFIHLNLDNKNEEHENTKEELAEAEQQKLDHYSALKQRLKYIYENGEIGYFQVIFNSKSFGDFLNRVEYVNNIITYDQNMYNKLKEIEDKINSKKIDIEDQLKEIEILLKEEEDKMLSLEQSREAKQLIMDDISKDANKNQQMLDEFGDQAKELEKEILKIQEAAAAAARASGGTYTRGTGVAPSGQYTWPVQGNYRVSSPFGGRVNPISGRYEGHTGVDIPGPYGTPILAASGGTVVRVGQFSSGYGNAVLIDHGGGMSTFYAHNSSTTVSVGQYVEKGQIVAKCGSTGYSTGNHLHFEVRINGGPVNPRPYLGY